MKRRQLLGATIAAASLPATVFAQTPARIARVVMAQNLSEASREAYRAEFAKHGWVDGRNLVLSFVDVRDAPEALAEARAREVVASRPDAIMMLASAEIVLFKRLTKDIPFVFYNLGVDPAQTGLVESLARPGGNFTGTSHHLGQVHNKAWSMLKEIHPAVARGGEVYFRDERYGQDELFRKSEAVQRESMQATASRLGITIQTAFVPREATLAQVVDVIRKSRFDALAIAYDVIELPGLIAWLEKARIPAFSNVAAFVRKGGLLAVTFDFREGAFQAVAMVARILRGESPATMPIYEGTRYQIAVNLGTARAMGLAIPASVRIQATEVHGAEAAPKSAH